MNRPTIRPSILLALGLLLCAPLVAAAADTRVEASSASGRRAELTLAASPLVTMQPTRLELRLLDGDSQLQVRQASCDLTMPSMPMPPNRPRLRALGDVLVGEAIFSMAGGWRASCTIDYSGGGSESFTFELGDVMMQ